MAQEALGYQSLLVRYIRQGGLVETQDNDGDSWVHWAQAESVRRAKLCGFSFLSLQSIAFGSLPVLLGRDIGLRLPTSCAEWLASGQEVWISERQRALELTPMPLALRRLLQQQPADVCEDALPLTSPFGNYILIHALHQQIYYARQLGGPFGSAAVDERMIEDLESALDLWKCGWEKAPESVLNLKNSRDSLSFAATALLGLAHVRLHFDLGAHAALQTCDPEAIASAALQAPLPELGDGLKHALLHAVHAINVPVQLGLENMARSQMFYWSVTHAVCDLECAIFLSKWLRALSIRIGERLLTYFEDKIIRWLQHIACEAALYLDIESTAAWSSGDIYSVNLASLNAVLLKCWIRMFEGCDSAWPYVRMIGSSLSCYLRRAFETDAL